MIEELLRSVPQKYLVGLETNVLTNQSALTRQQQKQKTWSRNHKIRLAEALGWYQRTTRNSQAAIWLLVDNILQGGPPWILRVPLLRHLVIATVLFHEIGHHIHTVHKPVYEGKENVADEWSLKLSARFLLKRYWYLSPFLYLTGHSLNLWGRIKKMGIRLFSSPSSWK